MKRRTLDIIFATGGLVPAALVLLLGVVLQSHAKFAKNNVRNQLSQQRIHFTPASRPETQRDQSVPQEVRGTTAHHREAGSRAYSQERHLTRPQPDNKAT